MRFALITVVTFTLLGCSGKSTQPTPTPPTPTAPTATAPTPARPPGLTFVWVVVLPAEGSGVCVRDASIEIVRGQGLGRTIKQQDPCSYWDPDYNAMFDRLIPGDEVTLRASAPGYAPAEITVVPMLGPQQAFVIGLREFR